MTPAMYIVTVICVTVMAISAMVFLPDHQNNNGKDDK